MNELVGVGGGGGCVSRGGTEGALLLDAKSQRKRGCCFGKSEAFNMIECGERVAREGRVGEGGRDKARARHLEAYSRPLHYYTQREAPTHNTNSKKKLVPNPPAPHKTHPGLATHQRCVVCCDMGVIEFE